MTIATETGWVGLSAAARIAGVSRTTLNEAARRGEIPCADTPLGRLYLAEDAYAFGEETAKRRTARHRDPMETEVTSDGC